LRQFGSPDAIEFPILYGTVGLKNGEPFLDVKSGAIEVERFAVGARVVNGVGV